MGKKSEIWPRFSTLDVSLISESWNAH